MLDQGHNFGAGLTQALTARMFNELRVGVNALRRENLPQSAGHRPVRRARDHRARRSAATDLGYPDARASPGYETLGDDPNLPVVAADAHDPRRATP